MNLVYGQDERVARWVVERIPHVESFSNMQAIGITAGDSLIGGVVFHEYRGNDIQMSCASESPRWLTKRILRALFAYPFVQLGCDRVTAFCPAGNAHTRQFLERIGFSLEGVMRRGFITDDCALYGLLREECKWIKE